MFIQTLAREKIELELLPAVLQSEQGRLVVKSVALDAPLERVARASGAFFGLRASQELIGEPPLGVFREKDTGLLRVVHKQIMLRWVPRVKASIRKQILDRHDLEVVRKSPFVKDQVAVRSKGKQRAGADLVDVANRLMDLEEVLFAAPDFVSQYVRAAVPAVHQEQWHLKNTAKYTGQKAGEDVKAENAWALTQGKRAIVVAVLDDGVEVEHRNLKANILRNPEPSQPRDVVGRDFFIPDDDHPEHYNPRPKLFQFPYDQMTGNDIHGTPCAGVVAATGKVDGVRGIAPKCRILAVKIFHADSLASDARVADAIRYAAAHADVLSCSWSGAYSPDIELALQDAGAARDGKGAAVFCAAGNGSGKPVGFPARSAHAVAVGASTDQGKVARYSNVGPQLWVMAPSSGGVKGVYTTDVSLPGRGFNIGTPAAGGEDGLHTNSFGGTSSATPLAAGVAALMLSINPALTRDQVKEVLRETADRIGSDHDPISGHSLSFGYGRVNAFAAVSKVKAM